MWLSLSWTDFITLSYIIRIYGHVMDDVITLWWSRESWHDLLSVLVEIFFLVLFCLSWCHFMSWCNQLNLGMIFLRFARLFCFSVILSDLVSFHILVFIKSLFLHVDFHFYTFIYNVFHTDKSFCCNVNDVFEKKYFSLFKTVVLVWLLRLELFPLWHSISRKSPFLLLFILCLRLWT